MKNPPDMTDALKAIQTIASDLRDPQGGCPWDVKQDHKSMIKHLVEETYEVVDALEDFDETLENTVEDLKKELGDLFFQVVFHAQLAREKKLFDLNDVARAISEKLVFRHPHVYGDKSAESSDQVLQNWEKLKREERAGSGDENKSILSGIARQLPALQKSFRMGQKVSRIGFDWPHSKEGRRQVLEKIHEEKKEFFAELPEDPGEFRENGPQKARAEEELGDWLFSICQLARHYHLDPERALQTTNAKFIKRFQFTEQKFADRLAADETPSLTEWNAAWQEAKSSV